MRKNEFALLILVVIMIFFTISLTGCNNNTVNEDRKSKIIQELDYLDTKIVSILNKLNNISLENYTITSEEISLGEESSNGKSSTSSGGGNSSGGSSSQGGESSGEQKESSSQSAASSDTEKSNVTTTKMEPKTVLDSEQNNIDWKTIKSEIEIVNEAWAVVILDLSSFNINNEDILNFSSTLDDCILSIKDENKQSALTNLAKLYSVIPRIEKGISTSNSRQNIKQVKSYIINAYSLVEQDDWAGIETNISESEKSFKNITNDIEYIKEKEYKVNRSYVLIKELQNSLSYRDKKLFLLKYKNLMESINVL